MTRPVVSPTAEEAYAGLVPWNTADENVWDLLKYVQSITLGLDEINQIVRDTDERPGWSIIMDVDNAPAKYLPWLAQFVGVVVDYGLSEADQRQQIKDTQGFRRGTPASMRAAAQLYLTGSKSVIIDERDTSPYHLRVRTFDSETPDPARVEAALLSEKPAGLVMEYLVTNGLTYDEIAATGKTYNELHDEFATSDQMKYAETI